MLVTLTAREVGATARKEAAAWKDMALAMEGRKVLVTEAKAWKKALAWRVMAVARKEEGTLLDAVSKITEVLVAMPSTTMVLVEAVKEVFVNVKLTLWGLEPSLKEDSLERGKGGL